MVLYTLLLIAFGTYGGGEGDYWEYKDIVENIHTTFDVVFYTGMEYQYNYLAYMLNGNYVLWRFLVFSIQFIGLSWFLYKAKLNTYPIFLCFISLCLVTSVYGRAFWGVIYFFMGIYLSLDKRNPLFLIAVLLCYVSHTQNIVLLALLPLAFIKIRRWHLLLLLVLFGTLVTLLKDSFNTIIDSGGIEGADHINDRLETYSKSELGNFGNSMGEFIIFVLRYVPLALIIFTWLRIIIKDRCNYLIFNKSYRAVLNITLGLIITSVVVLLAALGGGTFFYRIVGMTYFPIAILLPYMVNIQTISKKAYNNYILLFAITTELGYIKDMYYAYANGNF